MYIDETTRNNINIWMNANNDKEEIADLEKNDPDGLINAFYKTLDFGTGGLRGLMGIGTNRINAFTIKVATQALCNCLKLHCVNSTLKVFIGYDTRLNSSSLAEQAAKVLAGNGIITYLSESFIPTPLVSFACRFLNCSGAIMITASHNPANYNGFKVYWNDGGQVLSPHDRNIISEFNRISGNEIKETANLSHPKIIKVGKEIVDAYLENLKKMEFFSELTKNQGNKIKIAYSSLHGAGIHLVPQALKDWGFNQIEIVKEQSNTDGHFSTVDYPNPEDARALKLGIETMLKTTSDLLFVTDPDADRLGVVVNDHGKPFILSGNEIACLCLQFLCKINEKKAVVNPAVIKSTVTTELFQVIADSFLVPCFNVLPGFKYIAQLMEKWENESSHHFLFGCEESLGYLFCNFVRDKDAISMCNLFSSMALQAKMQDKTLKDVLNELYSDYGLYQQVVESIHFQESKEGHEKMQESISKLICSPPKYIGSKKVVILENYQSSLRKNFITQEMVPIHLPKSELLIFYLEDHTKIMIRPSGTEPKIKIYCEVHMNVGESISQTQEICRDLANKYIKEVLIMLKEK